MKLLRAHKLLFGLALLIYVGLFFQIGFYWEHGKEWQAAYDWLQSGSWNFMGTNISGIGLNGPFAKWIYAGGLALWRNEIALPLASSLATVACVLWLWRISVPRFWGYMPVAGIVACWFHPAVVKLSQYGLEYAFLPLVVPGWLWAYGRVEARRIDGWVPLAMGALFAVSAQIEKGMVPVVLCMGTVAGLELLKQRRYTSIVLLALGCLLPYAGVIANIGQYDDGTRTALVYHPIRSLVVMWESYWGPWWAMTQTPYEGFQRGLGYGMLVWAGISLWLLAQRFVQFKIQPLWAKIMAASVVVAYAMLGYVPESGHHGLMYYLPAIAITQFLAVHWMLTQFPKGRQVISLLLVFQFVWAGSEVYRSHTSGWHVMTGMWPVNQYPNATVMKLFDRPVWIDFVQTHFEPETRLVGPAGLALTQSSTQMVPLDASVSKKYQLVGDSWFSAGLTQPEFNATKAIWLEYRKSDPWWGAPQKRYSEAYSVPLEFGPDKRKGYFPMPRSASADARTPNIPIPKLDQSVFPVSGVADGQAFAGKTVLVLRTFHVPHKEFTNGIWAQPNAIAGVPDDLVPESFRHFYVHTLAYGVGKQRFNFQLDVPKPFREAGLSLELFQLTQSRIIDSSE